MAGPGVFKLNQPMLCAEAKWEAAANDINVVALDADLRYAVWGFTLINLDTQNGGALLLHHNTLANINDVRRIGGWEGSGEGGMTQMFERPIIGDKGVDIHISVAGSTDGVCYVWYTKVPIEG